MNDLRNYNVIAVVGATCTGKSEYAINLAKQLDAEIINGDSVQVYKDLNIGSAKITFDQMRGIKHHLLDFKNPDEQYTVADFQKDCRAKIKEINQRKKIAIIVGGTGLYIKAVLYNYNFTKGYKSDFLNDLNEIQIRELFLKKYPNQQNNIELNNPSRLKNYLIKLENNIPFESDGNELFYNNSHVIGLYMDREILYNKINYRVDKMFELGLINEVKQFNSKWPSQRAIGYKEIHLLLNLQLTENDANELIKKKTRNFAKKQITWFNNKMDVHWYDILEGKWR